MSDQFEASERRRPSRRRQSFREEDEAQAPALPLIYGVFSCVLCCTGPVAFALGAIALAKANAALDALPGGKRGRSARKTMGFAKILGGVGMGLSTIALIVGVTWTVVDALRDKKPPVLAQGPPPEVNDNPPRGKGNPPPPKGNPPQGKENPPPVIDVPVKKPIIIEAPKFSLVVYQVAGKPTPAQQADRVKQSLDATAGVVPGSVEVTETEIRFTHSREVNLIPVLDAMTRLGYKITRTTTSPIR